MKPYPHYYAAVARGSASGPVALISSDTPALQTGPPPEFDGPGGVWSPETLLVASVADCFVLTFRGVARAAHFAWASIEGDVSGTLDRVDGISKFTRFSTTAKLTVPIGADVRKAQEVLERAEEGCLIANSLSAEHSLTAEVTGVAA